MDDTYCQKNNLWLPMAQLVNRMRKSAQFSMWAWASNKVLAQCLPINGGYSCAFLFSSVKSIFIAIALNVRRWYNLNCFRSVYVPWTLPCHGQYVQVSPERQNIRNFARNAIWKDNSQLMDGEVMDTKGNSLFHHLQWSLRWSVKEL